MFNETNEKDLINIIKKMNNKNSNKIVKSDELFALLIKSADFQLAFSQGTQVLISFLDRLHVITIRNLINKLKSANLFEKLESQINPELIKIKDDVEKDTRLIDLEKYANSDIQYAGKDNNGYDQFALNIDNLDKPIPFVTYNDMYKKIKEAKYE